MLPLEKQFEKFSIYQYSLFTPVSPKLCKLFSYRAGFISYLAANKFKANYSLLTSYLLALREVSETFLPKLHYKWLKYSTVLSFFIRIQFFRILKLKVAEII